MGLAFSCGFSKHILWAHSPPAGRTIRPFRSACQVLHGLTCPAPLSGTPRAHGLLLTSGANGSLKVVGTDQRPNHGRLGSLSIGVVAAFCCCTRSGVAASSSRSQVAVQSACDAACLTWERPSVSVRWRPPLSVAIVTQLVTQPSSPRAPSVPRL